MSTNFDTVELVADTSDGEPDLDVGLGAPSGINGLNATGYSFTQPFPGILRVLGDDGSIQDYALPPGLPGKNGENGVTPTFAGGDIVLQPYGVPPAIIVRSTTTPNLYKVDLYLPDSSASAELANQYAGQAQGSAINSGNAASASQTSANNSASSATASQNSATTAAAAAAAAAASYDSFDDRYLGAKAAAPTVDNDGNPLLAGALYFDTALKLMRVFDGTAWMTTYAAVTGGVAGPTTSQAGNFAVFDAANGSRVRDAGTSPQGLADDAFINTLIFGA